MPVVFDEVIGNVRANEPAAPAPPELQAAATTPALTAAMHKQAMCVLRQRQGRLQAS